MKYPAILLVCLLFSMACTESYIVSQFDLDPDASLPVADREKVFEWRAFSESMNKPNVIADLVASKVLLSEYERVILLLSLRRDGNDLSEQERYKLKNEIKKRFWLRKNFVRSSFETFHLVNSCFSEENSSRSLLARGSRIPSEAEIQVPLRVKKELTAHLIGDLEVLTELSYHELFFDMATALILLAEYEGQLRSLLGSAFQNLVHDSQRAIYRAVVLREFSKTDLEDTDVNDWDAFCSD